MYLCIRQTTRQFISGLPFYFWRDMCGNNGDRAKADLAQAQQEIRRLREIVASYESATTE